MPRPKKCRRVCKLPGVSEFLPLGGENKKPVELTVDEYETVRLIDLEKLSQDECGAFLQVARTTVQLIYNSAREKIAQALVEGRPIRITGGDYRLCGGDAETCWGRECTKRAETPFIRKGDNTMKIAVTYDNGMIFQHFGHTEYFKVYEVQDGLVMTSQVVNTNGTGHGALAKVLADLGVDALICGGIGGGAQAALKEAGISIYGGVRGDADMAAVALAAGELGYDPNARCDHHDHEHGHDCGSHGCGDHGCGGHDHSCGGHCGH